MKKNKNIEDFDLIVMPGPLLPEDQKLISEFIRRDKEKRKKKQTHKAA